MQRAHVDAIPFENLDIHLGREIRIDLESVAKKLLDDRRGGYCFEQNALFASVLEAVGMTVTRLLARVRLGDPTSPRPETHMTLRVGDDLVDVGFGGATPLGPVPFDGSPATYGAWTWRLGRECTTEADDAWALYLDDRLLYTFIDTPRHPVDYVAPNHFTATHPTSGFVQAVTVQRGFDDVQLVLRGRELSEFRPHGAVAVTTIDPVDLGALLRDRFGLDLSAPELAKLQAALRS